MGEQRLAKLELAGGQFAGDGWYKDREGSWHYVMEHRVMCCGRLFRFIGTGPSGLEKLSADSGGSACVKCMAEVLSKYPLRVGWRKRES